MARAASKPKKEISMDTIKDYQQLIEKESVVHTYPYACITSEEASKEVVQDEK